MNKTKCEVTRYLLPGGRPNEYILGFRKVVDEVKDKTAFILDLNDDVISQLEAVKSENIKEVHNILNKELYKQTGIAYGEKPNL